jgi:diguanylate cyclase (GGDEF)-like protein/PAS domain S-box-containing protein
MTSGLPGPECQTLRALFEIACDSRQGLQQQVYRLLQLGCERFGLELGILAKITGRDYRVMQQLSPAEATWHDGDLFALQDTYCALTVAALAPFGFADIAKTKLAEHPASRKFGLKAYLGVPISLDGELYGTLSFASQRPARQPFAAADLADLQLMANWLAAELSRRQQEANLKRVEEKFRSGFYASPSAMLILNRQGLIEHVNLEAERLFQYSQVQLVGKPIEILLPDGFRAAHPELRDRFLQAPMARPMGIGRDLLAQNSQGEAFPVEVGLNPIQTEDGLLVLCAVVDLTDRKSYEKKILEQAELLKQTNKLLSHQAITDSLTNLSNRHYFMIKLKEYLSLAHRSGECVSVLMLDVDHFKKYNDTYGHTAGDEALKAVARELGRQTREVDIVARYGGEEFIVLLPATDREGAMVIAERIRNAVERITDLRRVVTLSGGVATAIGLADPTKVIETKSKELIERADQALYWSKQNGRNRVTHIGHCQ